MPQRKLLKIKRELDSLGIKIHLSSFEIYDLNLQTWQLQDDLLSLKLDIKKEAEQRFDLKEVDQHQKANEVNFKLPPNSLSMKMNRRKLRKKKRRTIEKWRVLMSWGNRRLSMSFNMNLSLATKSWILKSAFILNKNWGQFFSNKGRIMDIS